MKLVLEQKIAHGRHPVLRWMMDNIFIRTDPAGNIKPDKEKSTEKIDGAWRPLWHSTALSAAGTIRPSLSMTVEVYCLFDNRQVLTNLSFFIHYNENKSRANEV